jgi:hypothetical protein
MSREEQGSNCHPLQKIYIDRNTYVPLSYRKTLEVSPLVPEAQLLLYAVTGTAIEPLIIPFNRLHSCTPMQQKFCLYLTFHARSSMAANAPVRKGCAYAERNQAPTIYQSMSASKLVSYYPKDCLFSFMP